MSAPGRRHRDSWRIVAIVALVVAVHHGIYTIPYTYSEITGLQHNPVVGSFHTFAARMLTPKGLLQRPLSVFSYTVNYAIHGDSVLGFHLTNLAIHCVNTALVYLLARDFFTAPVVAALVFGLHPLATACVGQIFGRNYSLATIFLLLAFYFYLRWTTAGGEPGGAPRSGLRAGRVAILVLLFLAAVLTKQNLVILPALLAWHEIGIRKATLRDAGALLARSRAAWAVVGASALVGVALVVLYAIPLSRTATIPPGTFVLSQIASASVIARFYLLPYQTALIHDLSLYRDVAHPEVWSGLGLLGAIVYVAWHWRANPAPWLLGAILICLVPSNSILPKNEIIREWRLYPGLAFFALLVAEAVGALAARLRRRPWRAVRHAPHAALAAYVATLAHSDILQNRTYQSALATWTQVLARYPDSADAMNNIGTQHYAEGRLQQAAEYFGMAAAAAPEVSLYRHNLAETYSALGERELAERNSAEARRIRERYGPLTMTLHYR